jgi:hypothetical protein
MMGIVDAEVWMFAGVCVGDGVSVKLKCWEMKLRFDRIACGQVYIFSFLILIDLSHWSDLTVKFKWSTGKGLNSSLTLDVTLLSCHHHHYLLTYKLYKFFGSKNLLFKRQSLKEKYCSYNHYNMWFFIRSLH